MTKDELRALYKQIRLRMSPAEVATKSRMINKKLINEINWEKYKTICVFAPITSLNEVDISPLTSKLRSQTIKVETLARSKDIRSPQDKFDMVIVPCLAFDKDSYRLGWGGGFYDKFLAGQPQAFKLGVCFKNGFIEHGLPHQPHDIPMDKVITEI